MIAPGTHQARVMLSGANPAVKVVPMVRNQKAGKINLPPSKLQKNVAVKVSFDQYQKPDPNGVPPEGRVDCPVVE